MCKAPGIVFEIRTVEAVRSFPSLFSCTYSPVSKFYGFLQGNETTGERGTAGGVISSSSLLDLTRHDRGVTTVDWKRQMSTVFAFHHFVRDCVVPYVPSGTPALAAS